MNYEKFGATVTMSMEQIGEVVNSHIEDFDINKVTDMIAEIIERQPEGEKQKIKDAPPIVKLTYIAREMYSLGFMYGLYMYNETLKEQFKDMQARKKEREYKKVCSDNAKA